MVNQKKQLAIKREKLEKTVPNAEKAVDEAKAVLEEAERGLAGVLGQIGAKGAELKTALEAQPQVPQGRALSSTIENFGASVELLGTLFKARGLGGMCFPPARSMRTV